jgi:hypothetical protein
MPFGSWSHVVIVVNKVPQVNDFSAILPLPNSFSATENPVF